MSMFSFTIQPQHAVVAYRHGAFEDVLRGGRHRRRSGRHLVHVDLREQLLTTSPQEVPTLDGVSVRVTAAVRWSVADPQVFVERSQDPVGTVYLACQIALRDALAGLTAEAIGHRGDAVPAAEISAATAAVAESVGIAVAEVVIKDVILPAEVRSAAVELVTARTKGAAQLEAARGETAALRSMANAAKLLDDHPALARLRLVQAAPYGSQLVLRVGADDPAVVRDQGAPTG